MKKLFSIMLCLCFFLLCSCGGVEPDETPTTTAPITTTIAKKTAEMTAKAIASTYYEFSANPDDPFSYVVADRAVEGGINWPVDCDWSSDYVLYDTDGKGTMALLLGTKNPIGMVREIYTVQDGVVQRKLNANDYKNVGDAMIKVLKTGYIYTEKLNGTPARRYYRFEDGQLKLVAGLSGYGYDSNGNHLGYYRIDPTGKEKDFLFDIEPDGTEIPISDEELQRLRKKFVGDGQVVELDWKPLAEYGQ